MSCLRARVPGIVKTLWLLSLVCWMMAPATARAAEGVLSLDELVTECLTNSPDILVAQAKAQAAGYRIPQAKALPDPMFMFGYQNEGFRQWTIGKEPNANGMFSLSQQFFFPGKRALKGEMATRDAQSAAAEYQAVRLKVSDRIKEAYYDLFLAYKTIDILRDRTNLFAQVEDAASARYSSGMGTQQEVVMAQTEKYMLLEREEMQRQRIQALQGMLNAAVGRHVNVPLGRPAEPGYAPFGQSLDELIAAAKENSPEIRSKQRMVEGAEAKVRMAKKEYYPDVTLQAGYFPRTEGFLDMWNLTAAVNLPVFFRSKQRQALFEAEAQLSGAKRDLLGTEYMLSSNVQESYSMLTATEKLMRLYREGLIPKASQDVQLGLSGYVTGKTEAITVVSRLKAFLDYELLYWTQYTERQKAIARLQAITATDPLVQVSVSKETAMVHRVEHSGGPTGERR